MEPGRVTFIEGDCREHLPITADVIITDPPYGVDRRGRILGQIAPNYHEKGTHTRGYADHSRAQYEALLVPAFDGMLRSLEPGGTAVVFFGNRTAHQVGEFAERAGFEIVDLLVFRGGGAYAKSRSTLMPRHESAFYMRRRGGVRLVNPDRNIGNVFELVKGRSESEHPTTKPQSWMRRIVEVFTRPGDVVLDPFAGSGSTLIAAADLGRDAIGIEQFTADIARERLTALGLL